MVSRHFLILMISRHFAVREMVECTLCDVATGMPMSAVLSVTAMSRPACLEQQKQNFEASQLQIQEVVTGLSGRFFGKQKHQKGLL